MREDERKRALRKRLREERDALDADVRKAMDADIERRIVALPAFAQASVLLTYLDMGSEVRTRGIVEHAWAAGKEVALPRCLPGTRAMRWYRVKSFDGLVRSDYGIEEPAPDPRHELDPHAGGNVLVLVPGLAFDVSGYRLGYGGGYYDRFLAGFAGASVGLCREPQLVDDLGREGAIGSYDLPVQQVVTDQRVLVCQKG